MTTTAMTPHATPIYHLEENENIETVAANVTSTVSLELQKFHSLKDFTKELETYAKRNKKQLPQKKKQKLEFSYLPSSGFVPQKLIFSALHKCITDESFWSSKALHTLLEKEYIMPGLDDDIIFECILKYKSFALLRLIAKLFNVVADKYIIKTLKGILDSVLADETKPLHTYSECPVPDAVIADLSYAMLLPVNKITLKDVLKLLTLDEALILLHCFVFMLHVVSPALANGEVKNKKFDEGITETKIVLWMDLVLTAHLKAFASSQTLQSLIPDIRLCIQKQHNYYANITELRSFLSYIREEKTVMEKPIGKYTIETITM